MYPPKKAHRQTFEKGVNSDYDENKVPSNMARFWMNCRVVSSGSGNEGVIKNIKGTVMISTPLPDGINSCHAAAADKEKNKFYFIVYNSNGYHTFFMYDSVHNLVTKVLQSRTDSDGIDILKLHPDFPIFHFDIIDNNLAYFCDGYNKGRKFNIDKALDKTSTGYGTIILEDYITAYKKAPEFAPEPTYFTDITRTSNGLYGLLFKFCCRYVYDDGEISNYSDYSTVPLPPNQSYLGANAITYDNNGIQLVISTGSRLVVKIEIAVKIGSLNFQTCAVLNKVQLVIPDNSHYTYLFYNDGSYTAVSPAKITRLYSYMFRVPVCQSFVKNAMTYTGGTEGFPNVIIDSSVSLRLEDIYLPDATENKLNNPHLTISETAVNFKSGGFLSGGWYVSTVRFEVGFDVKKGNIFNIFGKNGVSEFDHLRFKRTIDNYFWTFTATEADNATSIANKIKEVLRTTHRGQKPDGSADPFNGVTAESTDGDGNVSFEFIYLGQYGANKTVFTGSVLPVSFNSLKDDGLSINIIKTGSTRQYARIYEDDDGRKSSGYTTDAMAIRTPFITEVGELKRAIHTIEIRDRPPIWAKYYQIVRTPDIVDFIQILIQQVIDVVTVDDNGEYLDLVVGSLFTYQKMHPNTVLQYSFERGDRMRLIKNTDTGTLYTPYYETEILSYQEVTTELVNFGITVNGSAQVTPADPVRPDYIGKNIEIEGIERTIIGITGGAYDLSGTVNIGPTVVSAIAPSYTFIDRRGIIRIKKPLGLTIADFSTVELFKPQKNTDNQDFKIFKLCGQKYSISNYGTDTRAHNGNVQSQDGTDDSTISNTPAKIDISDGDAYIRNRELPTNNSVPGTQVTIDHVEDPNYSDFYESNLHNLGLDIAKDDGSGEKFFGSRTRFSNNYIEDTKINGLNDYDNLDREDYNDQHGDVRLTRYDESRLILFKELKTEWIPIFHSILTDNSGQQIVSTSNKLLNQVQHYQFMGGIGNNPEGYCADEAYHYFPSTNAGCFLRLAGDGVDNISKEFLFDRDARDFLAIVQQNNLRIPAVFDRKNGNAIWSRPAYNMVLFSNDFVLPDWAIYDDILPDGATFELVDAPAHGDAVYTGGQWNYTPDADYIGADTFSYRIKFADLSYGDTKNVCVTVNDVPSLKGWRVKESTNYCREKEVIPPDPGNNFTASAQYGYAIDTISDGTCTGTPAGFATTPVPSGTNLSLAYTTMAAGTLQFSITGTGVLPHLRANLYVDGVVVSFINVPMPGPYTMTGFPVDVNDPQPIILAIDSY